MAQSRARAYRIWLVMALLGAGIFTTTGVSVQPARADVTAVQGSAFGYRTDVSLFGGPSTVRGFGQVTCTAPNTPANCAPETAESPSVTLPATGGNVTDSDPNGASGQYGPAVIFGGKWPDAAPSAPPSGPITVGCNGSTGAGGSVTCNTAVTLYDPPPAAAPGGVGPGPIVADEVRSTCTASESGKSASTTITNGVLETKYDATTQLPTVTEPIPANPAVNYTRSGTIDHVGDSYSVIFNEQINNADGSITVNAVHLKLLGPTAVGDLIIGQSVCGVTAVASQTTTTAAGNTTTTQAGATTTTQAGATTTTQAGATTTTQAGATTTTQAGATTTTQAGATTTTQAGATTTTSASGGNTTTTAAGGGGSVSGGACGYFTDVSLFGGPSNLRGCGQPSSAPATNASPSVTLPAGGSASPIAATDEDGAVAEYGPAEIFSGQYPPDDPNAEAPPSGPLSVSTQGTPGGTVTSSAEVTLPRGVGPGPVVADGVRSTCSAGPSGVSGSTTITNGTLVTSTTADGSALDSEPVPANPAVNYTRTGVITNVGDSFEVIYNEQTTDANGVLTVNAVHMRLLGPTAVGDLVIGQSRCGLTAGGGGGGAGGGGTATAAGGGVASTGTNALRLVAFALLLVAAGAHVRHWAPQLEWAERSPGGRRWPRPATRSPRRPARRPWD